jgi:hypothetical protein
VDVNFIFNDWEAKHVTIGLFEVTDISGIATVLKLQKLLDRFVLIEKIVAYVKNEGSNLQTCASALNFVVSCNSLGCWSHLMAHVLSMRFQRCVSMPLHMTKCVSI